jgi:hypothetical protein
VFVAALSCYDLWFLGSSMRVLDFEMLIRCFTFKKADWPIQLATRHRQLTISKDKRLRQGFEDEF